MPNMKPEALIFLDESGCNCGMAPTYGRSEEGARVLDSKPKSPGSNITLIGALSLQGVEAIMTVDGSTDGDVFSSFVQQLLVPTLKPGKIVIMDNVGFHKGKNIIEAIESTGAKVKFLPPYSPDLNPIESCWSKIKNSLRQAKARVRNTLDIAVAQAVNAVTQEDAAGWFSGCGYTT